MKEKLLPNIKIKIIQKQLKISLNYNNKVINYNKKNK